MAKNCLKCGNILSDETYFCVICNSNEHRKSQQVAAETARKRSQEKAAIARRTGSKNVVMVAVKKLADGFLNQLWFVKTQIARLPFAADAPTGLFGKNVPAADHV